MTAAQLQNFARAWSRQVVEAADLRDFILNHSMGLHDDPQGEPTFPDCLDAFRGDGWDLLVGPGNDRDAVLISGEIRDGHGYHPAATCVRTPPHRDR